MNKMIIDIDIKMTYNNPSTVENLVKEAII
jgi:hypothetical protein